MKHLILIGDMNSIDLIVKNLLAKFPKSVKQLSIVQAVNVMQAPPAPALKILGAPQPPPVQFVNMATMTCLYVLPGEEVISVVDLLPEDQKEQYLKTQQPVN